MKEEQNRQDGSAAACDANAEAHYLWDDANRCDFEAFRTRVVALVDKCQGGAAQAVPDAITNPHPRGSVDYHAHELFISGWNQCRLTMLEASAPADVPKGEPVAWRIRYADPGGHTHTIYHGHNAIADYRAIDPAAISTPLYTAPADTSGPNGWDSTRLDAAAIRNAALDEAAQLCEGLVRTGMLPAAIRALKTDQQEQKK